MIGPVVGGLMYAAWGPSVPYGVNAVTFLVSAALIAGISESKLRSEESLTRGHWRDVADGIRLVLTSAPLRTVLIVWNVVLVGSAAINVAEVVLREGDARRRQRRLRRPRGRQRRRAGARRVPRRARARKGRAPASLRGLDRAHGRRLGRRRVHRLDLGRRPPRHRRRGRERGRDHLQPDPRPARRSRPLPGASARDDHEHELRPARPRDGRGRRAHRRVRRRARSGWRQARSTSSAPLVSLVVTRWLPVSITDEDDLLDRARPGGCERACRERRRRCSQERSSRSRSLLRGQSPCRSPRTPPRLRTSALRPRAGACARAEPAPVPMGAGRDGSSRGSLERIAVLLEEIEQRRELEARRTA